MRIKIIMMAAAAACIFSFSACAEKMGEDASAESAAVREIISVKPNEFITEINTGNNHFYIADGILYGSGINSSGQLGLPFRTCKNFIDFILCTVYYEI